MSKYSELLKDPRWQKKRLKIMERDNFQCQITFEKDKTLCVHHKKYIKGKKPWEYANKDLITITDEEHTAMHIVLSENSSFFRFMSEVLKCTPTDVFILLYRTSKIVKIEGKNGIKTAIQLLTAYVIKQEEM